MSKLPLRAMAAIALAVSVIGCASGSGRQYHLYEGGERPPTEVATIRPYLKKDLLKLTILNAWPAYIDGKPTEPYSGALPSYFVLPGEHRIRVGFNWADLLWKRNLAGEDPIEMSFMAEVGHVYITKASPRVSAYGITGMVSFWIEDERTGQVVAGTQLKTDASAAEIETNLDVEPPKHLDQKGFFALPPNRAQELRVKSITTSDWLYEKDGSLTEGPLGAYAEYDELGRLIRFSGSLDQDGEVEIEYQYDNAGRIIEEKLFKGRGEAREIAVRSVFDYGNPKAKEQTVYDGDAKVIGRNHFSLDDSGRVIRAEKLDAASGDVLAEAQRTYDKKGNFIEESGEAGRTVYSLENNVLTVSDFIGPKDVMSNGELHSVYEYTFDERGNLLIFFRKSGDGSYWDRFTYKLDEQGLPVERVWSRLMFIEQDPFVLTKYSYEFYR